MRRHGTLVDADAQHPLRSQRGMPDAFYRAIERSRLGEISDEPKEGYSRAVFKKLAVNEGLAILSDARREIIVGALGSVDFITDSGVTSIVDYAEETLLLCEQGPNHINFLYVMKDHKIIGARVARPSASEAVYSTAQKVSHADEPRAAALERAAPEILAPSSTRQRSRIDKAQVSVWLDPDYKRTLLMLKAQDPDPSRTTESLVQEALDDLFAKHSMPPVPKARKKAKSFTHGD